MIPVRLDRDQLQAVIDSIEAKGEDATELRRELEAVWLKVKRVAKTQNGSMVEEEEYIIQKRGQSFIEHGVDLECMICKGKFDHLLSGACEACFKEWMLTTLYSNINEKRR